MGDRNADPRREFFVGQEGEFQLLDSFSNPIEIVAGKIVKIMKSENSNSVYAMIATERGIRPARLT